MYTCIHILYIFTNYIYIQNCGFSYQKYHSIGCVKRYKNVVTRLQKKKTFAVSKQPITLCDSKNILF